MSFLTFFLTAVCIIVAGVYLARSADTISEKTGLGKLIVGSLLLSGATSLTEVFVGYNAITSGDAPLAMGNLIGACLVNLLIFPLADFLHRGKSSNKFSRTSASHALAGCIFNVLMVTATMSIFLSEYTKEISFANANIGSWAILLTYGVTLKILFKNQKSLEQHEHKKKERAPFRETVPSLLLFLGCATVIALSSPFLVSSAEEIAAATGHDTSFIGLTLVALTTSLPEMVSTIQSVRMGSYELALGNIIGSNIYNIVLMALLDFIPEEPIFMHTPPLLIFSCLGAVLATSLAIVGQLYQVERSRKLIEPDATAIIGVVLFCLYVTYRFS